MDDGFRRGRRHTLEVVAVSPPEFSAESWEAYKALVLREMDRTERSLSELRELIVSSQSNMADKIASLDAKVGGALTTVKEDVARLNVKAGIWGALAGAIAAAAALLARFGAAGGTP